MPGAQPEASRSVLTGREHAFVSILHADLDSFYASVEQRDDPSLLGRPVIVGPGVVMAASYEAKARGVGSGMGAGRARRLCPGGGGRALPVRGVHGGEQGRLRDLQAAPRPTVEALSIDEAFLDVRGMEHFAGHGEGDRRAAPARGARARSGLPISVGVAETKFLAKVASAVAKPDGLLVVPPGGELEFLHPLPVERLWGVGPVTSGRLRDAGIRTVREVAEISERALVELLGRGAGRHLHALAHDRDPRRVERRRRRVDRRAARAGPPLADAGGGGRRARGARGPRLRAAAHRRAASAGR